MIVTVYWEDSRQHTRPKGYGPEQLLVACTADQLQRPYDVVKARVRGLPLNGASKVIARLESTGTAFGLAPLCAVLDHDKILREWPPGARPHDCKSGIGIAMRARAPGTYKLVLLYENMESLLDAAAATLGLPLPSAKDPEVRDDICQRLAFGGSEQQRRHVRNNVDGFDRLVNWTAQQLA